MNYYDDKKNVDQYNKMAEGYDGRELIDLLRQHLSPGSTILELGMGPGKDLAILGEIYQVTGSDRSTIFVEQYQETYPNADLLLLDAHTLDTDRQWDGIYSNKVLHHLTHEQLKESLARQGDLLNKGGVLCHSFWQGDDSYEMHGLHFEYYTPETLKPLIPDNFDIIVLQSAQEMGPDDTLYLILKKK